MNNNIIHEIELYLLRNYLNNSYLNNQQLFKPYINANVINNIFYSVEQQYNICIKKMEDTISQYKNNDIYKSYLKIMNDEKYPLCLLLEKDRDFLELVNAGFFTNDKSITFTQKHKFNKICKKICKTIGFKNKQELCDVWLEFQRNFNYVINNIQDFSSIIKQGNKINARILELERKIKNMDIIKNKSFFKFIANNLNFFNLTFFPQNIQEYILNNK